MRVHCRSCFREETWEDGTKTVVQVGGVRRPTVHPTLAAWEAIRDDPGVVVGTCPCGQPLLGAGPEVPWVLHLPDGDIRIEAGLHGPEGELTPAQVTERVRAHHAPRWNDDVDAPELLMAAFTMSPLLLVFFLWMCAATIVGLFLYSFTQTPGFH